MIDGWRHAEGNAEHPSRAFVAAILNSSDFHRRIGGGQGAAACLTGSRGGPPVPECRRRQLRSIEGWIPGSFATCSSVRPLLSSSATASRLNSSVKKRRFLVIVHLSAPSGN